MAKPGLSGWQPKPATPEVPAPIPGLPSTMTKEERMRERERISPTPRVEEVPAPDEIIVLVARDGEPLAITTTRSRELGLAVGYGQSYVRYVRAREGGR